jgi:hypothetical protein
VYFYPAGTPGPKRFKDIQKNPDVGDIRHVFNSQQPLARIVAGMMATAAFLAPLTVTVPFNGVPP